MKLKLQETKLLLYASLNVIFWCDYIIICTTGKLHRAAGNQAQPLLYLGKPLCYSYKPDCANMPYVSKLNQVEFKLT